MSKVARLPIEAAAHPFVRALVDVWLFYTGRIPEMGGT